MPTRTIRAVDPLPARPPQQRSAVPGALPGVGQPRWRSDGRSIDNASDAAQALEPLAGSLASALFATGLLGAALLAASILPLSTAYSVAEAFGTESALDDPFREAHLFYGTYGVVVVLAAVIVLVPGAPLIPILYLSQALNAVLLLPLLLFVAGISRDRDLMGPQASGRAGFAVTCAVIALIAVCVGALGIASVA